MPCAHAGGRHSRTRVPPTGVLCVRDAVSEEADLLLDDAYQCGDRKEAGATGGECSEHALVEGVCQFNGPVSLSVVTQSGEVFWIGQIRAPTCPACLSTPEGWNETASP